MSVRRRAIKARVEKRCALEAKRLRTLRIIDDVSSRMRADTYEALFLAYDQTPPR